ncbi:MAG: tetratricopeptide repeat protein, partial [Phycisphaerales bacterium]
VLKGRIQLELTEFEGALTSFDTAVELDEENEEAFYFKGVVYERIAQHEEALEAFKQASEISPSDAQYAVAVAEVLIDLERIDEAREFLEREETAYQHNAGVNQTLGHIAMMQGDTREAVERFEQARLLAPDNTDIMEDLAGAQMEVGRFAEAEYTFSRLLEDPENADRRDLKHLKAKCLLQVDRPVEARKILLELTDSNAGQADIEAWIALGNVAYKLTDMARLRTASARVVALDPNRFEGYLLRGLWERAQGQPSRAMKSLNRAIQLRGDDVTPLIVTGIIQREMGDIRGAREVFEMARRQDPDNKTVAQFLELLNSRGGAVATHPDDQ